MKLVSLVPDRDRVLALSVVPSLRHRAEAHRRPIAAHVTRGLVPAATGSSRRAGWSAWLRLGTTCYYARSVCGLVGFGPVRLGEGGAVIAWRARVWRAGVLAWLDHERYATSTPGVVVARSRPWVRLDRGRRYGQRVDVDHADGSTTSYAHLRQERPGAAAHLGGQR